MILETRLAGASSCGFALSPLWNLLELNVLPVFIGACGTPKDIRKLAAGLQANCFLLRESSPGE
jgi:hypothetical protein